MTGKMKGIVGGVVGLIVILILVLTLGGGGSITPQEFAKQSISLANNVMAKIETAQTKDDLKSLYKETVSEFLDMTPGALVGAKKYVDSKGGFEKIKTQIEENPDEAINAICEALISGRVPITRLEKALQRRKTALAKIESNSFVFTTKEDKDGLLEVEREEDRLLSKDLIINSIEIRNQGCLEVNHGGINLLRVDSVLPCPFLPNLSPALSLPQGAGYRTVIFHQLGIPPWQDDPDEPLDLTRFGEGSFLVQLFVRGNPFRGELLKEELWVAAIRQLQRRKRLCGLVVYGSPYLWNEIIEVLDTSIPASYSPGQMPKAQEQALVPLFHSSNLNEGFQSHEISDFTD